MNIQLIHGQFNQQEAIELITQLVQVKIKYHEKKIHQTSHEEDIKMREKRIKQLQQELAEARQYLLSNGEKVNLNSDIQLAG